MGTASRSPNCALRRSRSHQGLSVVYERCKGAIVGFAVRGHAGFARHGQDIVCAAVSGLVLSAAHGLAAHCKVSPAIQDGPARYVLRLRGAGNSRAQAVLATLVSGLKAIAKTYPHKLWVKQGRVPIL
jgi:uncharacterized protein